MVLDELSCDDHIQGVIEAVHISMEGLAPVEHGGEDLTGIHSAGQVNAHAGRSVATGGDGSFKGVIDLFDSLVEGEGRIDIAGEVPIAMEGDLSFAISKFAAIGDAVNMFQECLAVEHGIGSDELDSGEAVQTAREG